MPAPGTSAKSDERRRAVLDAAVACFSGKGFYGTATHEVAEQAGISQPYIYRLFSNKQALFAAAVDLVSELMESNLSSHVSQMASPPSTPTEALRAARMAYGALIEDRGLMKFLMHANCAADEPLVGDAVRRCYAKQVDLVGRLLGSDDESIRQWFGAGMLDNVVTTLRLAELDEPWARTMSGAPA
jgi:AcrR family transcriptional regulator